MNGLKPHHTVLLGFCATHKVLYLDMLVVSNSSDFHTIMSLQAIINDGNVVFTPKSDGIISSQSALLHRNIKEEPRTVTSAQGNYLTLDNGQRVLDATGGAAVACLGHGNKRVKRAIAAQMDEVSYCHSLFFGSRSGEGLARHLIDSTTGRMSKAFIVSSGIRNYHSGVFKGSCTRFSSC